MTAGLLIYSFGWIACIKPMEVAAGGGTGLAMIVSHTAAEMWGVDIRIGTVFLTINAFLLLLSGLTVGWNFGFKTLFCIVVASGFMALMEPYFMVHYPPSGDVLGLDDKLLTIILGALLAGAGMAVCFTAGGATGGTDIVAKIFHKYWGVAYGKVIIYTDILIIGSTLLVGYGLSDVVYGYIVTVVVARRSTCSWPAASSRTRSSSSRPTTTAWPKRSCTKPTRRDAHRRHGRLLAPRNPHRHGRLLQARRGTRPAHRPRRRPQSLRHHRIGFGHLRRRIPQTDPTPLTCPMERYADIVLPLAQPAYTYAVADGLDVEEGQAVAVQFGARRIYTGIVWRIHGRRPDFPRIKTVSRVLYDRPLLDARQRALWEWMADYYLCTLGEVMRFALPQTIKPSGNSEQEFADREYRPRTELYAALDASLQRRGAVPRPHGAALAAGAAPVRRAPGHRFGRGRRPHLDRRGAPTALGGRRRDAGGIAEEGPRHAHPPRTERRTRLRAVPASDTHTGPTELPRYDPRPLRRRTPHPCCCTASPVRGKTELYIHLIAEALARGGDVLLLVPEIAITAQLIARLERIFGSRVTAYHSKLTLARPHRKLPAPDALRRRGTGRRRPLGALSAAAAPATDRRRRGARHRLQADRRAAALQTPATWPSSWHACGRPARCWAAPPPSLESYANALSGKYGLATLAERYGDARPPLVLVSDTLRAVKAQRAQDPFQPPAARQARRRTRPRRAGDALPESPRIRPLRRVPRLRLDGPLPPLQRDAHLPQARRPPPCHYCGHVETVPVRCPACRAGEVTPAGFGTEKVEEELARLFPAARIERLDRDTATSERAYRAIIDRFESGQSDLLVGTQMITKGFDFARVSLVGILNADNLLFAPDFRAAERAFQLMTQVAGRAGRRDAAGEVVIQTTEPEHPVIRQVAAGDYEAMARTQLAERRAFAYPPYARLIRLTLRQRDRDLLYRASAALAVTLRGRFGRRAMGPVAPPVDRIREEYITEFLLKIESGASASRAREVLREVLRQTLGAKEFQTVTLSCDVDPQ